MEHHEDEPSRGADAASSGPPPSGPDGCCASGSLLPSFAPGCLSDAGLLDAVAQVEATVAALHAQQVALLAEFGRRGADVREYAADELAARLAWTGWTAQRRLDDAEALTDRLPNTLQLLDAGRLDLPRARTIVTGTSELDDECAAAVDQAIAPDAPDLSTRALARRVALEALAVDPGAAEDRARAARRGRRVTARPLGDGCARLVADGPAEDICTLLAGLTRACRTAAPGDDRGIDARRFDALTAFGQHLLDGGAAPDGAGLASPPTADDDDATTAATAGSIATAAAAAGEATASARPGRVRPAVLVTMTLPTLLGLRDDPAQLDGYGPLPASVAREIAENARLRRLLTDPFTGIAIGLDGHDYPGFRLDPNGTGPGDDGPGSQDPRDDEPGGGPPAGPDDGSPGPAKGPHHDVGASAPGDRAGLPPAEPHAPRSGSGPPESRSSTPTPTRASAPTPVPEPAAAAHTASVPAAMVASASMPATARPWECPVAATGGGGYRPRPLLDKLIRLRDQICQMPGCNRPASTADVDHAIAHPTGPTCPCNLHVLCRRHHQMKQAAGTKVARHGRGTDNWILPTGHTYETTPEPALAAATVAPITAGRRGFPGGRRLVDDDLSREAARWPHRQPDRPSNQQSYPRYDSAARDLERLRGPVPPDYGPPPF